ncbi:MULTISPECIES: ROK family protein [Burkholderia]|uniref:N-acylmannosamine kinase n=1 Tax=Burkholderia savannae TaxID=1637837 RepID=A0ABR5T3E7_9BURK|nr:MULTISPECIES: ROK family protein [Burkholderia]AOJ72753.1 N-acylmannosamine kinase [Burkholderia savannae]AOJ84713.1 N-acylmannosamine kinase [Burkholderia savannae]AOK49059.1 N-acylmannosamine kinase [Burkholderia sp. MSMB617WGS]KGS04115.1 winged helix-turn-helix DNA-binding family protein [Burkholderia sp. ABCPW 111]KVG45017.1 N-acylmannosamine kinase [Burkholderia sp. MSMB0265]
MRSPHIGQGSNSANVRRYNERLLLRALRRAGSASKADLARLANLTGTAVGSIIASLAEAKLIEFAGRRAEGQRGQPASLIRLDPRGAFGIGVRLDRMRIETALVNFAGDVIGRRSHDTLLPPPATVLEIVKQDVAAMQRLLAPHERERLAGVGVAQPYNLGSWLREIDLPADAFGAWAEVDFARELDRAIALPVFSENDGNAAAIAELFYGCGRQRDDFVYLFLGPAIGGGIAIDGDCLRGVTGNAGDFAMMPVPPSRLPSVPKPRGAWDILITRASLNGLVRHLRYCGEKVESRADLEACIARGAKAVDEWIDDCVDALAPALRAALAVLESPVVVLDADIDAGLIGTLIARLHAALAALAPEARGTPALVRGSFGPDAGAIGAATLPMFFNFSPRAGILRGAGVESQEARYAAF